MILLSDAMVLMDMGHVNGLDTLVAIAQVEVLDVVIQECEHSSQPGLIEAIKNAGIKEVTTTHLLTKRAKDYSAANPRLSLQDSLCLHYAKQNQRILLSNEKQLRAKCEEEKVEVHGTIWIMEQAHTKRLRQQEELCNWLATLSIRERRLPKDEIARLATVFGCDKI